MAEPFGVEVRIYPHQLNRFMRGRAVRDKLQVLGAIGEASAKQHAPVLTGNLRRSIYHEIDESITGWVLFIGTNIRYGLFQEIGTRFHPAHPYLRPAMEDIRRELR